MTMTMTTSFKMIIYLSSLHGLTQLPPEPPCRSRKIIEELWARQSAAARRSVLLQCAFCIFSFFGACLQCSLPQLPPPLINRQDEKGATRSSKSN